jgi:hypothetical protein
VRAVAWAAWTSTGSDCVAVGAAGAAMAAEAHAATARVEKRMLTLDEIYNNGLTREQRLDLAGPGAAGSAASLCEQHSIRPRTSEWEMEGFWKHAVTLRAWQLHQAGPTLLGVAGRRSWQGGCFRCYDRCDDDDPVPFAGGHRCAHEGGGTARPGPLWQMAGPRSIDDQEAYLEAHSRP